MGKLILIEGQPGVGKSRSLINLDPKKTLVIKPNNKDLPFAGGRANYKVGDNVVVTSEIKDIQGIILKANDGERFNVIVIEDLTHFMSKRMMRESGDKGYEKWTRLAVDVFDSFLEIEAKLRPNLYVLVIAHTQMHKDVNGNQTFVLQTPGQLLDSQIKIPSYFTYVFHADVEEGESGINYYFLTNRDGTGREAKSPEGCLELREPNDCQYIIDKIDKYQKQI